MSVLSDSVFKTNALPNKQAKLPAHYAHLSRLLPCGFRGYACFGREKEAGEPTPEASADLSDFLALSLSPRERGGVRAISVPFARENLHLVIPLLVDRPEGRIETKSGTQPLNLRLFDCDPNQTMAAILHAGREFVKWRIGERFSIGGSCGGLLVLIKKTRQVLNLPGLRYSVPRTCRVLPGFEPACAGGS